MARPLTGGAFAAKAAAGGAGLVGAFALFLFWPAGSLAWPMAWVLLSIYAIYMLPTLVWLYRTRPALLARRMERWDPNAPAWDKVLVVAMSALLGLSFIVAGLDHRFGWSHVPAWLAWAAAGVAAVSLLGFTAVFAANPYAARAAKLMDEQVVMTGGPYRFVRHPMYTSAIVHYAALALALGSWPALGLALATGALMVVRTALEDRMLLAGLPGYVEYAQRTRHRLLPGVW